MEPTTREKYTYYLRAFIHPVLSQNRMAEIFPEHIREWITQMQREGQSAWTIPVLQDFDSKLDLHHSPWGSHPEIRAAIAVAAARLPRPVPIQAAAVTDEPASAGALSRLRSAIVAAAQLPAASP